MFISENVHRISSCVVVLLLCFISSQKSSVTGLILEFGLEDNVTVESPPCSKGCKAETCINGTTCECFDGYSGDDCSVCKNCSQLCPAGTYGPNCSKNCSCEHGRTCNSVYGTCFCDAGYRGYNCSERCEEGTYGLGCIEKCGCEANVSCHHVTGDCIGCPSGFIGEPPHCNCDPTVQGENCTESCSCLKERTCSIQNDTCACIPEWTGKNCECNAAQTASVDPDTGMCICKLRWWGEKCTLSAFTHCPPLKYGEDCGCLCENYGTLSCDSATRTCTCKDNFSGKYCDECFCDDNGNCNSKIDCLIYSMRVPRPIVFPPIFTRPISFDFAHIKFPDLHSETRYVSHPSIRKISILNIPEKVPKKSLKAIFAGVGGFFTTVTSAACYNKRKKRNDAQPEGTEQTENSSAENATLTAVNTEIRCVPYVHDASEVDRL